MQWARLILLLLCIQCFPMYIHGFDLQMLASLVQAGIEKGLISKENIQNGIKWITDKYNAINGAPPPEHYVRGEIERMLALSGAGTTPYDIVIHADSLKAVVEGWDVTSADAATFAQSIKEFRDFKGQLFCTIGNYDEGKTWVLNQIEDWQLASGFGNVTSAFSFKRSKVNQNVVYIDTAGQKRTVASNAAGSQVPLADRIATDQFILELTVHVCDVIFYVVGPMVTPDITQINEVFAHQQLLKKSKGNSESFYVVHNLYPMFRKEDADRHVKDDVEAAFFAEKSPADCIWRSHNGQMIHLVLGRQYAPSGEAFNECTFKSLKNRISAAHAQNKAGDLIGHVTNTSQQIFPSYFYMPGMSTSGIPYVFTPYGVEIANGQTKIELLTEIELDNHVKRLVKNAKEKVMGFLSSTICSVFGMCNAASPSAEVQTLYKNPFAVVFDEKAAKIKLKNSSVELEYLPFTGDRPDAHWMPNYDLFVEGEQEWIIVVDLPGLNKDEFEVYCPLKAGKEILTKITITGHRYPPSYTAQQRQDTPFARKYGSFTLVISLPETLDCKSLIANGYQFIDGVLYLASPSTLIQERFTRKASATKTDGKDEI